MLDCSGVSLVNLRTILTREQRIEQAWEELQVAVVSGDDKSIDITWRHHQDLLVAVASAQKYRERVLLARDRLAAIAELQAAILSKSDERILKVWRRYASTFNTYVPAEAHRGRAELAERRRAALEELQTAIDHGSDQWSPCLC